MARRLVIAANLVYAVTLAVLGVVPEVPGFAGGFPDHAAHAIASAIQAGLLFALFRPRLGTGRAAVFAAIAAFAYGGFVESLQRLQPTRTVEIRDLAANAVGASAAASIAWIVCRSIRTVEGG